jgi:cytoskeletal protein CcmA (bactofilin family)
MSLWRRISNVAVGGTTVAKDRFPGATSEAPFAEINEADRAVVSEIARSLTTLENRDGQLGVVATDDSPSKEGVSESPAVKDRFLQRVVVERGVRISGDLYLDDEASIAGSFSGRIFSRKKLVLLSGSKGEGCLEVDSIEINGRFEGSVTAVNEIKINQGADVVASLRAPTLSVVQGAELNCECQIG